jgi:hypothetical protein
MSEFFVYPEDLSDVEDSSSTTYTSPSFSQELHKIIENEIKSKLINNKPAETKSAEIPSDDSKTDKQINLQKQ